MPIKQNKTTLSKSKVRTPTDFETRCYEILKRVPPGSVTTYADIAAVVAPGAARAVGQAMNKNPFAPQVPCHRVVCSSGRLGGFATGKANKINMLRNEGVVIQRDQVVDFSQRRFLF